MKEWTRSDTLALASNRCTSCHGLGLVFGKRGKSNPCNCVLRAIFRACYARFRHCVEKEKYMSKVSLQFTRGTDRRLTWGRKDEEYVADFILVSRRSLTPTEYRVFRYHFLLGADWKLCSRKFGLSRGNFFHMVYRIMHKLGRVFRELEPYGLYPLNEYFSTTVRGVKPAAVPLPPPTPDRVPVRPWRRAA